MFNKPSVTEAMAKVERAIMSCKTFTQLDSAVKMAENFRKAYYFSALELAFLFPQLKEQEANILKNLMNRPDVKLGIGGKYVVGLDLANGSSHTAYHILQGDGFTYRNVTPQIITGDALD